MEEFSVCKENMFYRIGSQCEFTKKICIPCMSIIGPLSCVATSVLRMRLLHVVPAGCVFKELTLVGSNQGNYFENATQLYETSQT